MARSVEFEASFADASEPRESRDGARDLTEDEFNELRNDPRVIVIEGDDKRDRDPR
jgi:hypothetical protein